VTASAVEASADSAGAAGARRSSGSDCPGGSNVLRQLTVYAVALLLAGCATRPIVPPLKQYEPGAGYRWANRPALPDNDPRTLLVLAFSGGGTRAAAFSYGVLEELRRTPIGAPTARHSMLSEIDLISSVSGGSFTALAYALKGEALFADYERDFLTRNVEGELLKRLLDPLTWPSTLSSGFGRSELAEQYYDDILFHGATFADLIAKPTPTAMASATDIATGLRWTFDQTNFDVICSDLSKMRLSRAAAASSAVPVVLSPVTIDNYGGRCAYVDPPWILSAIKASKRAWQGNRELQRYRDLQVYQDAAARPYIHLVDGGLSGNLGVTGIVDVLQELEASARFRSEVGVEKLRRVAIVIVNSVTAPDFGYSKREAAPSALELLLQAVSVPIDRYSYASVDALEDIVSEWQLRRKLEVDTMRLKGQPVPADAITPLEFSVINVSFDALADQAEREYLLNLPTSLSLPSEAIDRLRAAAAKILRESTVYRNLVDALSNTK
jgi:NTE family protein